MLIDTHCHLDFPEFDRDRNEVIKRAQSNGVGSIINIGSSLKGSRRSVDLAAEFDCIFATVGIHPHEADKFGAQDKEELRSLAGKKKVVAIGEVGLDYYKNYSQAEKQRLLFTAMVNLAGEMGLPLVIHCRQAEAETLEILKPLSPHKIVLHCFSSDEAFLRQCLDLGFFISFTCNITYKRAEGLRELVRLTPLERLFLETDAPFLAPQSMRGRRNEPLHIKDLAEEIAVIKGLDAHTVERSTTENARKFFNLDGI